jgi:hypothetical protein
MTQRTDLDKVQVAGVDPEGVDLTEALAAAIATTAKSERWLERRLLRWLPSPWRARLDERARVRATRRREDAVSSVLGLSPVEDLVVLEAQVASIGLEVASVGMADDHYRAAVVDRRLGMPDTPVLADGRSAAEAVCRATARAIVRATAGAGPES